MRTPSISLVSRLRRYLAVTVWVFALIVSSQVAFAASCVAEGLGNIALTGTSVEMHALPTPAADTLHGAPCWHAGSGGCHCACAHAAGLPVATDGIVIAAVDTAIPVFDAIPDYSTRITAELRPPIA